MPTPESNPLRRPTSATPFAPFGRIDPVTVDTLRRDLVARVLLKHADKPERIADLEAYLRALTLAVAQSINVPAVTKDLGNLFSSRASSFPCHDLRDPDAAPPEPVAVDPASREPAEKKPEPSPFKIDGRVELHPLTIDPASRLEPLDTVEVRRAVLKAVLQENVRFKSTFEDLRLTVVKSFATAEPGFTNWILNEDLKDLRVQQLVSPPDLEITLPGLHKKGKTDPKDGPAIIAHGQVKVGFAASIFGEKTGERAAVKRRLGIGLWHYLLGLQLGDSKSRAEKKSTLRPETEQRIAMLRAKPVLKIFIDSGSTTMAVVQALLRAKTIPLTIDMAKEADGRTNQHLILPSLITNSPAIAHLVSRSDHELRNGLALHLVGGKLQFESQTLCGDLAETFVENWVRTDLTIVGASEVGEVDGLICFGCYTDDEARMKARFLKSAFRVIIFDSVKLGKSPTTVFASLSKADVDLIVVDKNAAHEDTLNKFCAIADTNGVSVALV